MGNTLNLGVTRDKETKDYSGQQYCNASLSVEKYDILYQDFLCNESTGEPYSKSELISKGHCEIDFKNPISVRFHEIENYCRDIRCSKGWEKIEFEKAVVETLRVKLK